MKKPADYDTAQGGSFEKVNLGGHFATVLKVQETQSKSGKDMIIVAIDFDGSDKQAGYFKKQFDADTRADKKWPYQAVNYIMVYDYQDDSKTNRAFKAFVTSVEDSNGFKIDWTKDFASQFKGKKVGVVYGDVEGEYNGEIKTRPEIRWFCDYARVLAQKVPALKEWKGNGTGYRPAAAGKAADPDDVPF